MSTATLYSFVNGANAKSFIEDGVPVCVLNDRLGDYVYATREEALAFGSFMYTTPEARSKSVAIVAISFDEALQRELASTGDIASGALNLLGDRNVALSAAACVRLNTAAKFTFEILPLVRDDENCVTPPARTLN